jgi:hypothetical protein
VAQGTPIDLPLAISIAPLQLPPASRCVWQFVIDGEAHPAWQVAFSVRAA